MSRTSHHTPDKKNGSAQEMYTARHHRPDTPRDTDLWDPTSLDLYSSAKKKSYFTRKNNHRHTRHSKEEQAAQSLQTATDHPIEPSVHKAHSAASSAYGQISSHPSDQNIGSSPVQPGQKNAAAAVHSQQASVSAVPHPSSPDSSSQMQTDPVLEEQPVRRHGIGFHARLQEAARAIHGASHADASSQKTVKQKAVSRASEIPIQDIQTDPLSAFVSGSLPYESPLHQPDAMENFSTLEAKQLLQGPYKNVPDYKRQVRTQTSREGLDLLTSDSFSSSGVKSRRFFRKSARSASIEITDTVRDSHKTSPSVSEVQEASVPLISEMDQEPILAQGSAVDDSSAILTSELAALSESLPADSPQNDSAVSSMITAAETADVSLPALPAEELQPEPGTVSDLDSVPASENEEIPEAGTIAEPVKEDKSIQADRKAETEQTQSLPDPVHPENENQMPVSIQEIPDTAVQLPAADVRQAMPAAGAAAEASSQADSLKDQEADIPDTSDLSEAIPDPDFPASSTAPARPSTPDTASVRKSRLWKVPLSICQAVLLAALLLFWLPDITSTRTVSSASFDTVLSTLQADVDADTYPEAETVTLKRAFQIDPETFDDIAFLRTNDAMNASELLIAKCSTQEQLDAFAKAARYRQDSQYNVYASYAPTQAALVQDALIDIQGNYALYYVGENPEAVQTLFETALEEDAA